MFNSKMGKKAVSVVDMKDKLISLPVELFEVLELDAARCKRSVNKQIESILADYLEIARLELYRGGILNAQSKNNLQGGIGLPKPSLKQERDAEQLVEVREKKLNDPAFKGKKKTA